MTENTQENETSNQAHDDKAHAAHDDVAQAAHDDIKKEIHAIRREIVPESQIQAMIDARVGQVEAELRKDLNAQLTSLEDTLKKRSNEDRAAQSELAASVEQFKTSTDQKFASIHEAFSDMKTTITEKMDLVLSVVRSRDDEIKEIHRDVNGNQADVKANRAELNRLESDYRDFQYRVGDAVAVLTGKNPWNPAATRILVPLPDQVTTLSLKINEINEPVKRLLALEEKREKFKATMWEYAQKIFTSKWFWALLGGGALGVPVSQIMSQLFNQ